MAARSDADAHALEAEAARRTHATGGEEHDRSPSAQPEPHPGARQVDLLRALLQQDREAQPLDLHAQVLADLLVEEGQEAVLAANERHLDAQGPEDPSLCGAPLYRRFRRRAMAG
jgi:hypothetical protein